MFLANVLMVLLTSFIGSESRAMESLLGDWVGTGVRVLPSGDLRYCTQSEVKISRLGEVSYEFAYRHYCRANGRVKPRRIFIKRRFDLKNNTLFWNGEPVGAFHPETEVYSFKILDPLNFGDKTHTLSYDADTKILKLYGTYSIMRGDYPAISVFDIELKRKRSR